MCFVCLISAPEGIKAFGEAHPDTPVDIHVAVRHLEYACDLLTPTVKTCCIHSLGATRNSDATEMTRLGQGPTVDELRERPSAWRVINTRSPLQLDIPIRQGFIEMSSMGQPVVITPFKLAGAMAPVAIAGAPVLQDTEAVAAIAFSQVVRAGAPVVHGPFTSHVDMTPGAPAYPGSDEDAAEHWPARAALRDPLPQLERVRGGPGKAGPDRLLIVTW